LSVVKRQMYHYQILNEELLLHDQWT
jgi:hypothetical protein